MSDENQPTQPPSDRARSERIYVLAFPGASRIPDSFAREVEGILRDVRFETRAERAEYIAQLEAQLDVYAKATAAVLDEFHSWPNDQPPVTSKTLRPLWTAYKTHCIPKNHRSERLPTHQLCDGTENLMGCDISMYTERLMNGQWVHEGPGPYYDRNYDLFWVLGEVRGHNRKHSPIRSYRGIPEDASTYVKRRFEEERADAHSASWLSVAEMVRWIDLHPDQREVDGSSFWTTDLPYLMTLDERPEHVRIVFWFDN